MIIAIISLSTLLCILSYLIYALIRKNAKLLVYCESYIRVLGVSAMRVKRSYDVMQQADRLGAFEADDEVGTAFKEMSGAVEELHEFMEKYVNTTTKEADKEEKSKED